MNILSFANIGAKEVIKMAKENNLEERKSKQMDDLIEAVKMIAFELNGVRKDLSAIQEILSNTIP